MAKYINYSQKRGMGYDYRKKAIFRLKDGDTFKVLRNGEWVEDTDLWLEFVFNDWIDFETITEEEVVKYL